ncbi:G-protein coupled receptor GRL101-like [Argopecten irradians]|uniref:G-protein coupled receptor GRL101-like n=1 Tax=Argopecten irradians TaxID=31199 RepID=UPI0037206481
MVFIQHDTCLDRDKVESIFIPGKGCLFVSSNKGRDYDCNNIEISDWRDQLVATDIIQRFLSHYGIGGVGGEQHFLIKLTNNDRNFHWKSFIRDNSKRLSFTAWGDYQYADEFSTCISISITPGRTFSNWVYSRCSMKYSLCLNSTGTEEKTVLLPATRTPNTSGSTMIPNIVLARLFRCRQTGEYILSYFVCDHRPDCMDQSDENACSEGRDISGVTFLCDNGKYISLNLVCDFYRDCYDGSDERNCHKPHCVSGQWRCHSGQCIADHNVCDSEVECHDGSDEWSDTCNGNLNQIESVRPCPSSRHVSIYRMCDHIPDCHDGSDENHSSCDLGNPTYSCSTYCLNNLCNNTKVRVHLGNSGFESVNCSYQGLKTVMTTWPFSPFMDTSPDEEQCSFTSNNHGSINIKLLTDQPVSIRYRNEHILTTLIARSGHCTQHVELCFNSLHLANLNIHFTSDLDGLYMHNLTYCGNNRQTCDPYYGCYIEPPIIHPSCLGETTILTGDDVPIRWIQLRQNDDSRPVLRISPLKCFEDESLIDSKYFEPQLHCQNGMSYYPHHRCLMNFDVTGEPSACRDLTHLQNCETFSCPENYMKCPNSYCVPARLLCDGIPHCPNSEDEQHCDAFTCPGYFRCHISTTCIPLEQVCDGVSQCPRADDERHCDVICPDGCSCKGLIFQCVVDNVNRSLLFSELPRTTRGLSVRMRLSDWTGNLPISFPAMFFLSMQHCQIKSLSFGNTSVLSDLKSLLTLDLSNNNIKIIPAGSFAMLSLLQYLILNHNPIVTIEENAFSGLRLLKELNLFGCQLHTLSSNTFAECDALNYLNLSSNLIHRIDHDTFRNLAYVKTLDLRYNEIVLAEHVFKGLFSLSVLYVDSYTLCCAKPASVTDQNCFAPRDSISSCTDLIRVSFLRVALWVIGLCAVLGNIFVLVYRLKYDRINLTKSYSIFVISLSLSDILMGIYMVIIGVADAVYRGRYVWEEMSWRHSAICTISGILSTISSEASAFVILFITLDRTMAIVFPFSSRQFTMKSAMVTSAFLWGLSIVIAIIPISAFKDYFQGEFYSSSGVCLALPLSDSATPGSEFSAAIFVGLNFVIFLVIAICQVAIYKRSMTHQSLRNTTKKQSRDIAVARTLTAVVTTDFLCWFPIVFCDISSIVGMCTSFGGSLSGDVYAWIMILVLPINSALNPFLYTFANTLKRRKNQSRLQSCYRRTKSETEMTNVVLDVLKTFRQQKGSKSLLKYLRDPDTVIEVKEAFKIVHQLSKSLAYLHQHDLVHGNISTDSVDISLKYKKVTDAVFSMDHHKVSRDSEQLKDIHDLGLVVKALLRKINLP